MKNNINFIKIIKPAGLTSLLLMIATIILLFTKGINFGLDFTGGTLVQIKTQGETSAFEIENQLKKANIMNPTIQNLGNNSKFIIRSQNTGNTSKTSQLIFQEIQKINPEAKIEKVEFIGASIGEELSESGIVALITAFISILIYVGLRFEFRFAIGAIFSLIHDVTLTLGFFAATQLTFDLTALAAILAIIGYSLNDTIVVFDRIRENIRKNIKENIKNTINNAINETLSRTLITSLTTLIVVAVLFFVGGDSIYIFSATLGIGLMIGTYSSIYIAAASLLATGVKREDLLVEIKNKDKILI